MNSLISIGSTNTLKTRKANDNLGLNCPKDEFLCGHFVVFQGKISERFTKMSRHDFIRKAILNIVSS